MYTDKRRTKNGQVRSNEVGKSIFSYQWDMAVVTNEMAGFPEPIWDTVQIPLKEISTKTEVPIVTKITKGQFHNLGVSKIPLKRLHQDVVVHSVNSGLKVLAHSVTKLESRDGHRITRLQALDQRLSIPLSYQGWFELMSEDGRSMKPIDSVYKLAREFPPRCLVRVNVKGYMPNETGRMTFDKSKVVPAGEQLTLIDSVIIPGERYKYLRCTDSKGGQVFLGFDQQGMFTPIAGPDDVSGVFTIKDIVQRFRLPITVKLVQGVWPKVDASKFTGIIRLDWTYKDDTAFLCPVDKHSIRITPVPVEIPLKFTPAKNMTDIQESQVFKDVINKCNRMVGNYNNTIHLIVSVPTSVLRKAKSHEFANALSQNTTNNQRKTAETKPSIKRSKSKEDILNDDVDELYQYLREGKQAPKHKFQYDSDEESYFEEPEFEPMNDFRARVAMIESGQSAHKNSKYYRPTSAFVSGNENKKPVTSYTRSRSSTALVQMNGESTANPTQQNPPPLPPRRYTRTESSPVIRVQCNQPAADSSSGSSKGEMHRITSEPKMHRKSSYDSMGSGPKVTSGSDNRSSKTGSSGKRHSLHTLYL